MIQRIQTVWLLVAGLLSLGTFWLAFWISHLKDATSVRLCAQSADNLLIYIAAILLVALSFGTIFLFKQRPLQTRLCLLGIVVSVGLLILEDHQVDVVRTLPSYASGSFRPGIALPILVIIALFMAIRGIRKDQKLVKSLNRLR